MATVNVHIDLRLRPHQLSMFQNRKRFEVRVVHRRFGKTFLSVAELLVDALQTTKKDWRGYYIAPTYRQAKGIAWDYIKSFVQGIPGTTLNESELRVDLPNGSRIRLLGAEQYDTLRGLYADAVVIDETAMVPTPAWTTVISPMLADRKGRATFIGTPMGRMNLFFDLYEYAQSGQDDEWQATLLTYKDTGVLDDKEIKRLRGTMTEEEFSQELECSWNAARRGAYYAQEMAKAEKEGRITQVRYDNALPVVCAVDLGWSDAMVATFWQQAGTEHRCLKALAYERTSIADMVQHWRGLPFPVDTVVLPHDAKVHELGTGRTRQEIFHSLGCDTVLAPNQKIHEGIAAVRDILGHCWWDYEETKTLREAMVGYRSEFDEVKQVHRVTPLHSWESHWADSVRYYALGRPSHAGWGPKPAFGGAVYA